MPTQTESLWTRMFHPFRRPSQPGDPSNPAMPVSEDDLLTRPEDGAEPVAETVDRPGPLARWARRDQAIQQLQEGYERVTKVMEDIQTHLAQQGERSERICGALEQIAKAMVEAPQIARQQAQTLDHIAAQIESTNARSQQLAEIVSDIPKVTRGQTETLTRIGRQLEISNEQGIVASQTIDRLGSTLRSLGETSQTHGELIREASVRAAEQGQQLVQLVGQQSRRFMLLFGVTIFMALAAVAATVVGLTLRQ
jgi:hypothetical protein